MRKRSNNNGSHRNKKNIRSYFEIYIILVLAHTAHIHDGIEINSYDALELEWMCFRGIFFRP